MRLAIGRLPAPHVRIERALGADPRCLGGKRHEFSGAGAPEVVHLLRVAHVADQAAEVPLALDVHFVAENGNDRDIAPSPLGLLQHFRAGHDRLRDLVAARFTIAHHLDALRVEDGAVHLVLLGVKHDARRKLNDALHVLIARPVLGHAHRVFLAPQFIAR